MTGRLKFWFVAIAFGILPVILLGLMARTTAAAGLWYVAPGGSDAGDCQTNVTPCATINAAIGKASPGDTINVATGTYTAGSGAEVVWITQSVSLLGGWNSGFTTELGLSTVDGQNLRRGMTVSDTAAATAERFVFQNGQNSNLGGGGIYNEGALTVTHSQVRNSSAQLGGGIYNSHGNLTVLESQISGNAASLDGGGLSSAFGQTTILSSTITGNYAGNVCCYGGAGGAGIDVFSGFLSLRDSTVSGNMLLGGFEGAGILNGGVLTVTNSTISNNSGGDGSGIYSFVTNQAFYNATISGNSGPGLYVVQGHAALSNTILSGNGGFDCYNNLNGYTGTIDSFGYNLIERNSGCSLAGTDVVSSSADLALLQDNGGPAPTQAILPGSPAINGGNPGGCFGPDGLLATDERGYPRNGRCDIGAFEAQPLDASDKSISQNSAVPGQTVKYTVLVGNSGASPMAGVTVTDTLPAGLNFVNGSLTASSGSFNYSAGVITWTGTVNSGASVAIDYAAASLPNTSYGTVLTNTAVINGNGESVTRRASLTVEPSRLFLPAVFKPQPGLWGNVTVNGLPASGVFLELRRFDGAHFSTQATATTGPAGYYLFNPPSLPPGQFYYVRYLNTSQTPGYLSYWATAQVNNFTAGSSYGAGNFDLADISLVAPNPGATVALPALFQWVRRPATPTDSYQLSLFDPNGSAFGQTNLLGYVNGIVLTSVPGDFHAGTTYGWYMAVNSPGGGYGESFYYRTVTFNNVLAPSQPAVTGGAQVLASKQPVDRPRP